MNDLRELDGRIEFIDKIILAAKEQKNRQDKLRLLASAERQIDEFLELFWRLRG